MTTDPCVCLQQDSIESVMEQMASHQVRRIPIVDNDGAIVGIVSQADIATRLSSPKETGQVVQAISEPADVPESYFAESAGTMEMPPCRSTIAYLMSSSVCEAVHFARGRHHFFEIDAFLRSTSFSGLPLSTTMTGALSTTRRMALPT